jgi:hypothetical protein
LPGSRASASHAPIGMPSAAHIANAEIVTSSERPAISAISGSSVVISATALSSASSSV